MSSLDAFHEFFGLPTKPSHEPRRRRSAVRASYDLAQTTHENSRHWQWADGLSAASAASPSVRKILRNRSRYEAANNSYLAGIVRTLAGHVIGRGPRINLLGVPKEDARFVEKQFRLWAEETRWIQKLRTMRHAKAVDGESFAMFIDNPVLASPVKLDLRLIEAEQVASPSSLTTSANQVDGIAFDGAGNATTYTVLRQHPGDGLASNEADDIPARQIIHLFWRERPDQRRGLPELMTSLPLFAYLRRYTLAVVSAAEAAASHAGIIYSDAPADADEESELEPLEEVAIDRGMYVTLPRGYRAEQMKAEQPTTGYKDFKGEVLNEAARPFSMPKNIATSDSSGYNYSSGRLDHQTYYGQINIDRDDLELDVCDRTFATWLAEAVLIEDYLPDSIRQASLILDWEWYWTQPVSIDPVKDAKADETDLATGKRTYAEICARDGRNWEDVAEQRAREANKLRDLGLSAPGSLAPAATDDPSRSEDDLDEEDLVDDAAAGDRGRMIFASASSRLVGMSGPATIQAAGTNEDGSPRLASVQIRAYNGGLMEIAGYSLPVVVDLDGLSVRGKHRPILYEHDPQRIVGHTVSISKLGGTLDVSGIVSGTSAAAQEVLANAQNGFPWQASIGARPGKVVNLAAGKQITVNGRLVEGPAIIVRTSQLKEVSFVALGADDATSAAIAARQRKGALMPTFEEWVESLGLIEATLDADQKKNLRAAYDALHASDKTGDDNESTPDGDDESTPDGDDVVATTRRRAAAEAQRITRIQEICGETHRDILSRAIGNGWSATKTELEVLRASRPKGPAITGQASKPAGRELYAAAVLLQTGANEKFLGAHYSEDVMDKAISLSRGVSLGGIAREILAINGIPIAHMATTEQIVQRAINAEATGEIRASGSGGLSPATLSGILGDSANKSMAEAYQSIASVFRVIGRKRDLKDFKATSFYRLEATGLQKLPPGGEIKSATLAETSTSLTLGTAALLVGLSRAETVNDDLGAFMDLPKGVGANAARYVEQESATVVLANAGTHFSAGNNNYFEGATTVLSPDSLGVAVQMFEELRDSQGKMVGVPPKYLLVPSALKTVASALYKSDLLLTTGSTAKTMPAVNVYANTYEPLSSPYLGTAAGLSGSSNVAWYLVADPSVAPMINLGYLRGNEQPTISEPMLQVNRLSIDWQVYFDFAVALAEKTGAVKSKGAA